MGYWGPGNLESDYALGEVDLRSSKLIRSFLRRARKKVSREWDEYEHTALLVDFEYIFALAAKGLVSAPLPKPEEVEKLKSLFLVDYDVYGDGPRPAFRKVLVSNFNR
jgi:hypothetical protein